MGFLMEHYPGPDRDFLPHQREDRPEGFMPSARREIWIRLLAAIFVITSQPAAAQTLVATVPVGINPRDVVVNASTNKVYVLNTCTSEPSCSSDSTVTVIDGATLATTSVTVGIAAATLPGAALAVNRTTNKIYVLNPCGNDPGCQHNGTMTIIDGATLATTTVTLGQSPNYIAVNEASNKIYVVDTCNNNPCVTAIDGVTLATNNVPIQSAGVYFYHELAVNPVTNKIYVTNPCGTDPNCQSDGTVTIIDGMTLSTQTITVGMTPEPLAVNTVTNKIYVANTNGLTHSVTVIDGVTLSTTSVPVGVLPVTVAVNESTNTTYVGDAGSGDVTIINGMTLSTQTVPTGSGTWTVVVNSATNQIYVTDQDYNYLTDLDGSTLAAANISVGQGPITAAVNQSSNRIFVVNQLGNSVSVIDGTPPTALQFVAAVPCRVVDTRNPDGPFGGPPIPGGTYRSFAIPQNPSCGIPGNAAAYSLNVTVVPRGRLGYLTVWPSGEPQPRVSTLNSDGRTKADAAIVPAGVGEAVSVYATDTTDLILDIDGYFVAASGGSGLAFYPLTPCRVADTRNPNGLLGGPYLHAGVPRDFPILQATSCDIPASAQAYSLNLTALPHGHLGYLTVWPTGQNQPLVSTLNAPTGTVTANAAIVPSGTDGEISTYAYNDTDLIIDINGYFAAPAPGGLSLYAVAPCRLLDTRGGGGNGFMGQFPYPIAAYGVGVGCDVRNTALGYVFNATVVPYGSLGYLTLWPDGGQQPDVSTLNAYDGVTTSNMAIVPAGNQGDIDAYAYGTTNLILDIFSYFAP